MELRQLEYLVAVSDDASFTRAAARLHVSQPAVSTQIKALERELGQVLLDRSGRTVRCTDVGAAVLAHARAAVAAATAIEDAVEAHTGLLRGRLSVGMVSSSQSAYDMAGSLARFHDRHPGVEVTLTEANSDQLIETLRTGRLDVAVIAPSDTTPESIELITVADEPLVAAVSPDHPIAQRSTIPLRDLHDQRLITFHRSVGASAILAQACADAGFRPRIAYEASDPEMLVKLAVNGLGIAILPESYTRTYSSSLRTIHIVEPSLRGSLALAWRASGPDNPAARAFVRSCCGR